MRVTTVAIASIAAALVVAAPVAVAPVALSSCCVDGPCDDSGLVAVQLSCGTLAPATLTLTGSCATTANPESPTAGQTFQSEIDFYATAEGTCHFEINLTDGFAYSGSTTFIGHPPSSCGCQPFFTPSSPSKVFVDVPSADCVADAGEDGVDASGGDGAGDSD